MDKRTKRMDGKKCNFLTVIKFDCTKGKGGHAYWWCKCICGRKLSVRGGHLREGRVESCGCRAHKRAGVWLKKYASSDAHRGKGNPQWKGPEASYSSVHKWLVSHFQKTNCANCDRKTGLDWALLKGKKYDHNRDNFIVLCRSCHLKYDYTKERRIFMGKMLLKSRQKKGLCG